MTSPSAGGFRQSLRIIEVFMKVALAVAAICSVTSLPSLTAPASGSAALSAQGSQAPFVPKPFPGSAPARPADQPPPAPAPAPAEPAARTPAAVAPQGLPVYPTAEFIDGFDAGLGQRYYLYGTDMPYEDIVAYYRNILKNGGREVFREPPMRQFDLGRFQEDSMAFPPSVVVKDYTWNGGQGFLAVSGTTERRYRTIIQIVPPTTAAQ
jgi:hypothetical protein